MLKKVAVAGLVLLLAGTAVLVWVLADGKKEQQEVAFYQLKYGAELKECFEQYNEWLRLPPEEQKQVPFEVGKNWNTKTEAQLLQEQQGRLKADLDRLAVGEKDVYPFADVLYGGNWQKEVSDYKKLKERDEFILTCSIVSASAGGVISVWCFSLWIARLIIRELSYLWEFLAEIFTRRRETAEQTEGGGSKDGKWSEQKQKSPRHKSWFEKRSKVLVNSGWQSFGANCVNHAEPASLQTDASIEGELYNSNGPHVRKHIPIHRDSAESQRGITALLSGQESITSGAPLIRTSREGSNVNVSQVNRTAGIRRTASSDSFKDSCTLEDSLKAQTENLEKQMVEVKQMAQNVQQAALEHSKPLDNVLKELTQQVGAIREYATCQQEKVKRLQEGYDWNIIKSFCLRTIRCIDNLESRIARLSEQDIEVVHLKEVRDELIFLLESSGVERFELEINSDYHGQEKLAEVVKEKEYCYDRSLVGKIAKVIRAGYQYFIDDDNFKMVRPAQVKLFG
jgi:molecular chaperone GrpE (heat shock protein)